MNRKLRRFQDRTSSLSIQHRVPFGEKSTPRATAVTQLKCYTGSIIIPSGGLCRGNCGGVKFENRLLFLHRHRSRFKWNFGGKTRVIFVSHTNFVQFVQNQNIVKTRLVFPTKARNAEILLEGSNDHFSGY